MTLYIKYYECECGCEWTDTWDCLCNDRCPDCNREIQPYDWEEAEPAPIALTPEGEAVAGDLAAADQAGE